MKKLKFLFYSLREVYTYGKIFFWLYIFKSFLASTKVYLNAWLSKKLLNEILLGIKNQRVTELLIILALLVIIGDIIFAFINLLVDYFSEISTTKYNDEFSMKNSLKCSRLKYELHDSPSDKNEVKQFLSDGKSVLNLYCQSVTIIFTIISFIISLYISIEFSAIITVVSLVVSLPAFFIRKQNKNADYQQEKNLNLKDRIIDYYKGVCTGKVYYKEVHLFGTLSYFAELLNKELNNRLEMRISLKKAKIIRETILLLTYSIVNIFINIYIIIFIIIKNLTIGDYTYYNSIINNLKNNSDTVITSFNEFLISLKKVENYYLFFHNKDNEYPLGALPMPEKINSISFINVWFKYPNTSEYVLKDVSFQININEKIALAGINGAGKTTVINLLLRFYEPSKGNILINSNDIRLFNLKDYWKYFSCMFQHSNLYNVTLKENLLFGCLNKINSANDEALCMLLSTMGINISSAMLEGHVSKQFYENGLIFSPGETQKINVIRTLIKDAPIVILDEPSSSMDVITEDAILETAFTIAKEKIMFFISHRLSNLKKVDKIVYLENGRIEEIGTHDELMEHKAKYYSLYNKQSQKYL